MRFGFLDLGFGFREYTNNLLLKLKYKRKYICTIYFSHLKLSKYINFQYTKNIFFVTNLFSLQVYNNHIYYLDYLLIFL